MSAQASGWEAKNPNQQLTTHFNASVVRLQNGGSIWGTTLEAYGYGKTMIRPEDIDPQGHLNRVEYHRGLLTEWYVNGPLGLEQGFTFARRPGVSHVEPLKVTLVLSGNLSAKLMVDKKTLELSDARGTTVLRYAGLEAYDASGKQLPAWLELHGQELSLKVSDAQAKYPVVVDPIMQLAKITASGGSFSDGFGASASINGNTVVVGAPTADGTNGAAYVFVKPASGWTTMTETAKLTASDAFPENSFGGSVGVSSSTVIVGKDPCTGGNSQIGKVYVYVMPSSGWVSATETAQLSASDAQVCDSLGGSVAIYGNTIVAGELGNANGAAYVFVKPATGWATGTSTAKLTTSLNDAIDRVAINKNTVVAMVNEFNGKQQAANVFVKPAGGWHNMTQSARLTASDGAAGDFFDFPSIWNDTIAVGAPLKNGQQGEAYVFVRPSTGWVDATETARLTASDGVARDNFGIVATDGQVVAVGAEGAKIGGNSGQGAIYLYAKPPSAWITTATFTKKLTASDGAAGDALGSAVSITGGAIVGCDFTLACYIFGK